MKTYFGARSPLLMSSVKKVFFIITLIAIFFMQKGFAQDNTSGTHTPLSQLLNSYYNMKDALVAGNTNAASTSAEQFVMIIKDIDNKAIDKGSINTLQEDAGKIADTRDIRKQREVFANFSNNMISLARNIKLTTDPIYETYCPMKKSYWLSSNKSIKNPYFGNAMLTCGKVTATLQ